MRYAFFGQDGRIESAHNDDTVSECPAGAIEISEAQWDVRFDLLLSGTEVIFSPRDPATLSPEKLREIAKIERAVAVSKIVVTTQSGNIFDGDEESQGRMSRAIQAMNDGETVRWVLADNTVVHVDNAELREALRLAGAAQSALWVIE